MKQVINNRIKLTVMRTLEEVKQARDEAQSKIDDILADLVNEFDLKDVDVDTSIATFYTSEEDKPVSKVVSTKITVKI